MRVPEYRILRDPTVLAMLSVGLAQSFAGSINGFSIPYIAKDFGLDDATVASFFGWIGIGNIATFYIATHADQLGRRKIIVLGLMVCFLFASLSAWSPTILVYIIAQMIFFVAAGAIGTSNPVLMTEYLPFEHRSRGHSLAMLAAILGAILSLSLLTLFVKLDINWRNMWLVDLGLVILALSLALPFLRDIHDHEELQKGSLKELFDVPFTRPLVISSIMFTFALAGAMSYQYYHLISILELGQQTAGLVFLAGAIAMGLGTAVGAAFSDKVGRIACAATMVTIASICVLGYYLVRFEGTFQLVWIFLTILVWMTAWGALAVAGRMAATELFPAHLNARYQGMMMMVGAVSAVIAHFSCSYLTRLYDNLPLAVCTMAVFTVPGLIAYMLVPETKDMDWDGMRNRSHL